MKFIPAILAGVSGLLFTLPVGAQESSAVAGRVVMGTFGAVLPTELPVEVIDLSPEGDPKDRRKVTAAPDGAFRAPVAPGANKVLLSLVHQSVTYTSTAKPGDSSVELKIFERTSDPTVIEIASDTSTILKGEKDDVEVLQVLRVSNASDRTFVGGGGPSSSGVMMLPIPEDAYDVAPAEAVNPHGIMPTNRGIFTSAPIFPGETSISYIYKVKAPRSGWQLSRQVLYPTRRAGLLVGEGLTLRSASGFDFKENKKLAGPVYKRYEAGALRPGASIDAALGYGDEAGAGLGWGAVVVGSVLLAALASASLYLRRRPVKVPANRSILTREALVKKIAELDRQFDSGDIPASQYEQTRAALKEELADMVFK